MLNPEPKDSDLIRGFNSELWFNEMVWNLNLLFLHMFQSLISFVISLHEMRKDRTNRTNHFSNWWCCNLSRSNYALCTAATHIIQAWGEWRTLSYVVRNLKLHSKLFQTVSAQPQMSVLTSCCSLRTCTVLPQIQLQQQRRAVSVCCVHVGCINGYTTKSAYVFASVVSMPIWAEHV